MIALVDGYSRLLDTGYTGKCFYPMNRLSIFMHISMVGIFVLNFYIHYKLVNTGVSAALHSARLVAGGAQ